MRTLEETGSMLMLYVLHDVHRVEEEVRRSPALSKFLSCQQFGVDIESHNSQPLCSFPWPYFCDTTVYISSREIQKSPYVNTVCVETYKRCFLTALHLIGRLTNPSRVISLWRKLIIA